MKAEETIENQRKIRRYLIILWSGIFFGVVVGIIGFFFEDEINDNPLFLLTLVFLAIPYGIVVFTLLLDILKLVRWWVLVVMPLSVLFPWFLLLVVPASLFSYLFYVTYQYIKVLHALKIEAQR